MISPQNRPWTDLSLCLAFNMRLFGSSRGPVASVIHVSDWSDVSDVAFEGAVKFDVRHPLGFVAFGSRSYEEGMRDIG